MNQASIFTLDKNAKGYKDFEDPPQDIYVDTSAWLCIYGSQNANSVHAGNTKYRGSEIIDFMGKCLEEGVHLHHSSLVLQEAIHANKKAHYDYIVDERQISIPRFKDGKINFKKLRETVQLQHPDIVNRIRKDENGILDLIKNSSEFLEYKSDEEFFNDIQNAIDSTNGILDTQDAEHICIARSYSINSFLTADGDYIYLDNANIFVPRNEKYIKERMGRKNVLLEFNENEY